MTTLGAMEAFNGNTSGAAPSNEEDRAKWYAAGNKPHSWNVFGSGANVPLATLGPAALAFYLPTAAREAFATNPKLAGKDYDAKMFQFVQEIGKMLMSQTPAQGMGTFIDALSGEGGATVEKSLAFTASQLNPFSGLQRYAKQWLDPTYYKPQGFGEAIRADIPFMGEDIATHKNPDGTPAKRTMLDILPPYSIGIVKPEIQREVAAKRERDYRMAELKQGMGGKNDGNNDIGKIMSALNMLDTENAERNAELPHVKAIAETVAHYKRDGDRASKADLAQAAAAVPPTPERKFVFRDVPVNLDKEADYDDYLKTVAAQRNDLLKRQGDNLMQLRPDLRIMRLRKLYDVGMERGKEIFIREHRQLFDKAIQDKRTAQRNKRL
jgi:hypothetical protein